MQDLKEELKILRREASSFGIKLSIYHLELFELYLNELWQWNSTTNLIGNLTKRRIAIELFLDSLVPAPFLPTEGYMLDAGSGGGFPGIPLKIYLEGLKISLLDSNSKKVSFLKYIVRKLGLKDVKVIRARLESNGWEIPPEGYQVITAKALAPLYETIRWCTPHLSEDGLLVVFSKAMNDNKLLEVESFAHYYELKIHEKFEYVLPPGKRRSIIIFSKEVNHL
jgi:16S rRNA (guanine527-N7)-methyltransferase